MSYPKIMTQMGKHGDRHILIQNEHDEGPAWLAMFHAMDQWDQAYCGIEDNEDEFKAYTKAKTAPLKRTRWAAAKGLLTVRDGVEYEGISIVAIDTPFTLELRLNATT